MSYSGAQLQVYKRVRGTSVTLASVVERTRMRLACVVCETRGVLSILVQGSHARAACARVCYCVCARGLSVCECERNCEYERNRVCERNCMCKRVLITCASVSHVAVLKLQGQREDGFEASVQGGQTK